MSKDKTAEERRASDSTASKHSVNFFRPASDHARANMKLIVFLVLVWGVCVFGFQWLLEATNKPTPEPAYARFAEVWPAVSDGTAQEGQKQDFARSVLAVLGKNVVLTPSDRELLQSALHAAVAGLLTPEGVAAYRGALAAGDTGGRAEAVDIARDAIGLGSTGFDKVMADLLPTALAGRDPGEFSAEMRAALPGVMEIYLVHNQGPLTDARFLGFPFHYWYTAQFLLILFIVLCLIYAVLIDRINKRYGFVEE